jgi:hypothetical protein
MLFLSRARWCAGPAAVYLGSPCASYGRYRSDARDANGCNPLTSKWESIYYVRLRTYPLGTLKYPPFAVLDVAALSISVQQTDRRRRWRAVRHGLDELGPAGRPAQHPPLGSRVPIYRGGRRCQHYPQCEPYPRRLWHRPRRSPQVIAEPALLHGVPPLSHLRVPWPH